MRTISPRTGTMIVLMLATMVLSGCRKYLDFEGENKPPRLVINGVMEADSVFSLDLSHSLGYIDIGEISGVENGTVTVFLANGQFVETLSHVGEGRYMGEQVAVAGQAYRVNASAGNYPDVFAVDQVPPVVEIAGWDTSQVQGNDMYGSSWNISFQVNDPGGMANFYMIEAFETRLYDLIFAGIDPDGNAIYDTLYLDEPQRFPLWLETSDLVLSSEYDTGLGEVGVFGRRFLFTDELFNGSLRQFAFRVQYYSGNGILELRLTSCSSDLFRYYRSFDRYQNTSGDPFSEPVQVFNNIQGGGLGIWGGRSSHSVLIGSD